MAGRPLHTFTVIRTQRISPQMVRITMGDNGTNGFGTFAPSAFTDSYVKLAFVPPGIDIEALPRPLTLDSFGEQRPVVRTYTVRGADPSTGELTIDFVVHGDRGVAGPWALAAQPGDPVYLAGPNGAYSPDPQADWHLLAADEAGLPALSVALAALPADAVGQAFVEVAGPDDELALTKPDGVTLTWVHRGSPPDAAPERLTGGQAPLVAAVKAAPWLPGQVQVFIHGEAQVVMHNLRPYIRTERGVGAQWAASISGYWRRGRTEESFKVWKRELAEAEAASTPGNAG